MCDICRCTPCISPRCPNYKPDRTGLYCSACGEGIYTGDEYIENNEGDTRHYDCFYGTRELLDWLGFDVKVMGI